MNRSHLLTSTVAWPTCALGAWGAAWIAGRCSPDDVAEALAETADEHVVRDAADESTAAGRIPTRTGVLELLALVRPAQSVVVRLPSHGDPQGLPPGVATTAALVSGEVLLLNASDGSATVAMVPELLADDSHHVVCSWTVHRYPDRLDADAIAFSGPSAGDLEYELRQAVREATEIIGGLGGRRATDLSDLRDQLASRTAHHRVTLPSHPMDARTTRLIDTAAQVEAIVDIARARGVEAGETAGQWDSGDSALRSLTTLTRSARVTAVNSAIAELLRR